MYNQKKISYRNILLGMILTLALVLSGIGSAGSVEPNNGQRGSSTISGYIYDNVTGEVIPDVEVRLYNYNTEHEYQDYSYENGYYEFDNLEAGEYKIGFYNEKYYYFKDYLSLGGNDNQQYDSYLDPYECTIFGYIYDGETNEPINEARIFLEWVTEDGSYRKYDTAGNDGYYDFFMSPGEYKVVACPDDYKNDEEQVEIFSDDELQVDFYLSPLCSIYGIVYDGETLEPLTYIDVALYEEGSPYGTDYDWSNETGHYAVYMEPGEYLLRAYGGDRYKYFEENFEINEGDHIEYDIYLEPELTKITGYVYNLSSGEPIEDAYISADNYDTWEWDYAYTDENGYYDLYPGVGEVSIWVSEDGYKDQFDSITMEEDVPQERDYYLDPYESSIFGTVYDEETSEPLTYAYVTIQGEDFYETTGTDSNGDYSMYLDGGEYTVSISQEEYFTYETTVTIEAWEDYQLDVYLEPFNCLVFGYVTNGDGEYIEDAYASISSDSYSDYIYTDEDGYYEFECPPSSESGEYRLYVSADGYRPYQENFWLEAGEDLQVDVELQEQWSAGSIWRWIWEQIFGS